MTSFLNVGGAPSPWQLGQNRRQSRTFERLLEGPKGIAGMRDPQDQEPIHGKPEVLEAEPIGGAGCKCRIVGLNAEHLPAAAGLPVAAGMPGAGHRQGRDAEPEPQGGSKLQFGCGRKLM